MMHGSTKLKFRERVDKSAATDFSKFWQLPGQEVQFETTAPKWIPIMCAKPISSNREGQCRAGSYFFGFCHRVPRDS